MNKRFIIFGLIMGFLFIGGPGFIYSLFLNNNHELAESVIKSQDDQIAPIALVHVKTHSNTQLKQKIKQTIKPQDTNPPVESDKTEFKDQVNGYFSY